MSQMPRQPGSPGCLRSLLEWRVAVAAGRESEPEWDMEAIGDGTIGLVIGEFFEHPEVPPVLSLCQLSEAGEVLGQIWVRPADLVQLIADLRGELDHNYRAGRRWLGEGPVIDMGLGPAHEP